MTESETRTFCRFCVALCGLVVTTDDDDRVVAVRGDRDHPVSRGYTCVKGRGIGRMHHSADRLDGPLLRRQGSPVAAGWDDVLDDLSARIAAVIAEHGPDAVALYTGTAFEYEAAGAHTTRALHRAIGSRSRYTALSLDTPCKPYVARLVGGDARLAPHIDEAGVRLTLVIGTNPVVSHGHTFAMPDPVRRLRSLAAQGEVWTLDPRRTETAALSTHHLALRPGTDFAVIGHVIRELLPGLRSDASLSCVGVDALASSVASLDATRTSSITGLDEADLAEFVAAVRRAGRLGVLSGTGATMARAANVTEWLVWALLAVTDSLDQRGGMWFNPGYLHRDEFRRPATGAARPRVGSAEPDGLAPPPGLLYERPCALLAEHIEAGHVRALVVVGGNPLSSFPQPSRLRAAFERLDVLAVADVFPSETSAVATHVLACAGPLERADLPVGLDRVYNAIASHHTAAVVPPAADRRALWWIAAQIAERLGVDVLPGSARSADCSDEAILDSIAAGGRGSVESLRHAPTAVIDEPSTFGWVRRRLDEGHRWHVAPAPLVEQLSELIGSTENPPSIRLVAHRRTHTFNSMNGAWNRTAIETPSLSISAADAVSAGLADGDEADVATASGVVTAALRIDHNLPSGVVTLAHGGQHPNVNVLTSAVTDATTGMVQLTDVAVALSPARRG